LIIVDRGNSPTDSQGDVRGTFKRGEQGVKKGKLRGEKTPWRTFRRGEGLPSRVKKGRNGRRGNWKDVTNWGKATNKSFKTFKCAKGRREEVYFYCGTSARKSKWGGSRNAFRVPLREKKLK